MEMMSTLDEDLRVPGTGVTLFYEQGGEDKAVESDPHIAGSRLIANREVFLASVANTRVRVSSLNRYLGRNSDAAVVAAVPGIISPDDWEPCLEQSGSMSHPLDPDKEMRSFINDLVTELDSAAMLRSEALSTRKHHYLQSLSDEQRQQMSLVKTEESDQFSGGAVASVALYDPRTDLLRIRTKGDCPIYLYVKEGENAAVVQINEEHLEQGTRNKLTHYLGDQQPFAGVTLPPEYAECLCKEGNSTVVRVRNLADQLCDQNLMDKAKAKSMLVMTSDGVPNDGIGMMHEGWNDTAKNQLIADMIGIVLPRFSESDNPALLLADMGAGAQLDLDDRTACIIPLGPGGDTPIISMMADGFGRHGQTFSHEAAKISINFMHRAEAKAATAARTRLLTDEMQRVREHLGNPPTGNVRLESLSTLGKSLGIVPVGGGLRNI